jgi:hypothetical protein
LDEPIASVVVLGAVFADLIADLLHAAVNPRIRRKEQGRGPPTRRPAIRWTAYPVEGLHTNARNKTALKLPSWRRLSLLPYTPSAAL